MKGIFLIAVIFVTSWTVITANDIEEDEQVDLETNYFNWNTIQKRILHNPDDIYLSKCPDEDPMNTTIHLPHEYDCTKFYMCLGGEKILKVCPCMNKKCTKRLHFNPKLQVCDWPGRAGCKNKTPEEPDDDCPIDDDGNVIMMPHECKCNLFYQCREGWKVLRECPKNKYFSYKWQGCVPAGDSECMAKKRECKKEGDLIPHECDCSKYYKCKEDEKVLQKCPEGLHFNAKKKKCEDPKDAGCETPHPRPGDCPNDTKDGELLPHQCDCRLFYKCENKRLVILQCSWGYYYNKEKKKCERASEVSNCKNEWDDWLDE